MNIAASSCSCQIHSPVVPRLFLVVLPQLPYGETAGFGQQRQWSAAAETFGKKDLLFFLSDGLALNRIPFQRYFAFS